MFKQVEKVMQKKYFWIIALVLLSVQLPSHSSSLEKIDCIYCINLDERPEKWKDTLEKLSPYHITPKRFSAINGKKLSPQRVNQMILTFLPGMQAGRWVSFFPPTADGLTPEHDFLTEESYGKPFVINWMSPGAIGCILSHLAILEEAYAAGYETIWIMEDDIVVHKDPHLLSMLIEKLDLLTGKEGWDILYTDSDIEGNGNRDERHDLSHMWRPDADPSILKLIPKRKKLSEDFIKIQSRTRTHSMVIRRPGMKKIIDYLKTHKIFLPYDDELAFVPNIKSFMLTFNLVSFVQSNPISDTSENDLGKLSSWLSYKQRIISEGDQIPGWHYLARDEKLLDFLYEKKPKLCVEIGAFGGFISYQIAKVLEHLQEGSLYAIDAWDNALASEGLKEEKLCRFWKDLNMEAIYQGFQQMLKTKKLEKYCHPIRQDSKKAVLQFADHSIDFLYIDGNQSTEGSLQDVLLYFPKVKQGGYIWLNDSRQLTKHSSVDFLMKHCTWIKESSAENQSILFQKNS
jgi:GR25 family glycosyltransferase involved in LPS biosynthesis